MPPLAIGPEWSAGRRECPRKLLDPIVLWSGTRVTCEMVSDGGGRSIPAGIVSLHTLSLLIAFLVAHDRATEDNHT